MNAHKLTQITIMVACLALAGCASTGAATPTAAQPPQPTTTEATAIAPTEVPQPTATSAATSVPVPTQAPDQTTQTKPLAPENTPIPTATSYPAPVVPLSSTGPWLVSSDHPRSVSGCYLWAINQDGTGLTRLTTEPIDAFSVRPTSSVQNGITVAYVIAGWASNAIKFLSWPSGDVKTIVSQNRSEKCVSSACRFSATQTAYEYDGLMWSPSGNKLAFVSAIDDTSLNVFVYDAVSEQITRIAVTDLDDFELLWSADERYVIFQTFYEDAMSSGPVPTGVWSARADAGGVTQLVGQIEGQFLGDIEYLGWLSPTEIIVTFSQRMMSESVSNRDIRLLNIETGDSTTLVSEPFLDVAYSPEHNLLLMTKEVAPSPNRLLIFYQNGERREIAGYTIKQVQWLSENDVFLGHTVEGRAYLISPDGAVTEIPTPAWSTYDPQTVNSHSVIVSPDHQWWAWHHTSKKGSTLWVGPAMAQPSVRLDHPCRPIWSPNSQYLLCPSESVFVASPPNFEASLMTNSHGFWNAVWVQ